MHECLFFIKGLCVPIPTQFLTGESYEVSLISMFLKN